MGRCGPRRSNVAQSSYNRSPVNNQEDHVGTWQQGEILPTTPVHSFYGSGPRGARTCTSTFSNSRSSQLQDPDVDLRLQEDNVEDRLHNKTPPTTSRGGVDVLANEVAKTEKYSKPSKAKETDVTFFADTILLTSFLPLYVQ